MKKSLLALFFLFVVFAQSDAQIRFQKTYGGAGDDAAWFVKQTIDGGYLICGYTTSFGSGGRDAYIIKTDAFGSKQWSKTLGGSSDDEANYAIEDSGGYVISGITSSYGAGSQDGFLTRLDASGNIIWFKTYGTANADYGFCRFKKTFDNGFILLYPFMDTIVYKATLIKTDANGNKQWTREYGIDNTDVFSDLFELPDSSGYFVWGYTYNYGFGPHDVMYHRVDSTGTILWTKVLGNSTNEGLDSYVFKLKNNEAFATSIVDNNLFGPRDLVFMKINYLTGNVIWAKEYGRAGKSFRSYAGTPTLDGGFASEMTDQSPSLPRDMEIIRTDSLGNLSWVKKYGGAGDDISLAIWNTKDNGFALVGYTTSFGAGGQDIYFVKTDVNGNSGCNESAEVLQQGNYTYNTIYPTLPEIFPVNSSKSYSVSSNSGTDSIKNICGTSLVSGFLPTDTTFCGEGGGCIDFIDFSIGNPTSWKWSFPGAFPDTSNSQNPTNICFYTTGTYAVTLVVTSSNGKDSLTVSPMVIVAGIPPAPVITRKSDTLFCSHSCAYQWYYNGLPIANARDSFYVQNQNGTYAVRVTDCLGCNTISQGFLISVNKLSNLLGIKISPNPVIRGREIRLRFNSEFNAQNVMLDIFDMVGEKVYSQTVNGHEFIVNNNFSRGVYFVRLNNNEKQSTIKFIVQ